MRRPPKISPSSSDKTLRGMETRLRASGWTDKGPVRAENEDRFAVDLQTGLLVVADGMGGHNAGEVAAQLAVEAIAEVVAGCGGDGAWPFGYDERHSRPANLLRTACAVANRRVFEAAGSRTAYAGMGTTVVAALVHEDGVTVAHVGDSRAYLVRGGQAQPLTTDHSWWQEAFGAESAPADVRAMDHPMRHALTRVVGLAPHVDVDVQDYPLEAGDLLLLTSDGVHGAIDVAPALDDRLVRGTPEALAGALVRQAVARGSRDNCTAVVACRT